MVRLEWVPVGKCISSKPVSCVQLVRQHHLADGVTVSAMNVSGPSVALLTRRMSIPENVIVIHDSIEHKPLTFAPRFGGSHNGHNGVRNIIAALRNNKDFHRFRIGVGKPNQDAAEYVMGEMSPEEHKFWTEGDGLEQVKAELDRILNGQMH